MMPSPATILASLSRHRTPLWKLIKKRLKDPSITG